ncbi:MAG TPA: hypothetical protein VGZ71_10190 [Puia sp.]|jgi:hypothetical protein|nr:hypothetical protein [Puia sp.]
MTSILVSFRFNVCKKRIEDIFESQNIVSFKDKTNDTTRVYHVSEGIVSRYLVEAYYAELPGIRDFFVNLPEVRSVYASEEVFGARRIKRNSFEDKEKRR